MLEQSRRDVVLALRCLRRTPAFTTTVVLSLGLGIGIGLAGALTGSRLLGSLRFEVSPTDPLTLVGVSILLFAVALLACYIPARRASSVNPAVALRAE